MSEHTSKHRTGRSLGPTPEELKDLLECVRRLPDARIDKVQTVRDALRNNAYENERILDETVERLCADFPFDLR